VFLISSDLSNQITLYDENDKIARLVAFTTIQLCCVNQFRTYRAFKAELYCKYILFGPIWVIPQTASWFVQMFLHGTSVWPTQRQTDTQTTLRMTVASVATGRLYAVHVMRPNECNNAIKAPAKQLLSWINYITN